MTNDEYETVIGKLVLAKLYLTHHHYDDIDALIVKLEAEYMERRRNFEL